MELVRTLIEEGARALAKNKLQEAENCFAQAIGLDEGNADIWGKLGLTWIKMGKFHESVDAYTMANHLSPRSADILYNLGLAELQAQQSESGVAHLEESYHLSPTENLSILLGDIFHGMQDYQKSGFYYLSAYKNNKTSEIIQYKTSIALYRNGDLDQALGMVVRLVNAHPTNRKYIDMLTDFYRRMPNLQFNSEAKKALEICLKQDNIKFPNLRSAWSSIFLFDPSFEKIRKFGESPDSGLTLKDIASELDQTFLCEGLIKIPASGIKLEYMLTNIRKFFLLDRHNIASWPKQAFTFVTALAVQCWFTDYVYYVTPEEQETLDTLEKELREKLENATHKLPDTDAVLLALYACYEPLCQIYDRDEKPPFGKSALYQLRPLLHYQWANPRKERDIAPVIPGFTEIKDETSREVQKMYENRPYPRWNASAIGAPDEKLREISKGMDILVAGCGTGQEPAFYANMAQCAEITAVDLSRTSIAYGWRQAEEMGFLPRIHFMHGDLMDVAKIGKTFDYITSSGVLHHMKEPEKGLAAITPLLKPNGRMSLSLYSKIARDHILNPALDYIREKGYGSSAGDIRQFRRDLFNMQIDNPILRCTTASDFYNLSECTDLLFHVQEHRFTLLEFRDMAARQGLEPFNIYLSPEKMKAFQQTFPGTDPLDFDTLTKFEEQHPQTFLEMYKIYFKRIGDEAPHPFDGLIRLGAI